MSGIAVLATGLVTAVGFNAEASLAAIRAGVSGIATTTLSDLESGEDLCGARVPLPQWSIALEKLADLVAPAISECLRASTEPAEGIPILLGLPEPSHPGRFVDLDHRLLAEVEFRLGLQHHPDSGVIPRGHVSGAHGLLEAERLIANGHASQCVVAGVQSYLRPDIVEAFFERRRLMTESNSNGFFPGEAGAALLVGHVDRATSSHLEILGVGLARERATIESDEPLRAEGLTDAIRGALNAAGASINDTTYRITDLSGEHYKFKEAAFAAARFEDGSRQGRFELWHPIEYIGEVGAAILPCMLAVAFHAGRKGYAPGAVALCHAGSDDGDRAALVVRYSPGV